ncbi:MAG: hypothetical protein IKS42_07655 [Oscillospiraceae bacterium]|nr:hypothetical protein [Oscillospiraceae bacterium]
MKGKLFRKTAAAVLVAIVGGAVPAGFGGADLFAAPIVADAADEVGVGTRWYIGDTIDTDAYFDVMLPTYDTGLEQVFVNKTLQLKNTTLPECWPLYINEYQEGSEGVQFTGVIDCVTLSSHYYRMAWDNETEEFWSRDSDFWEIAFYYDGERSDVKGIEITGGKGTQEEPYTLGIFTDADIDNKVTGASITLDGTIGVNFYAALNSETAKAVLSGPNGDIEITDLESVKQESGQYKFSYPVYSNQAAEKVSLSFFDADGVKLDVYNSGGELDEDKAIEFSVNDYIAAYEASENTKLNDLVAALDNYCKAADNYFNGAGNTVEGISGINYNSIKGYAPTLCGNKMALLLNADTSIRIFYEGDATQANLNYGDAVLTKITKGGKSYFEIPNISADKLSEECVLVIGEDTLAFSALSYSVLALKKTTDQNLWNLSKALCVYADAAKAYKASL